MLATATHTHWLQRPLDEIPLDRVIGFDYETESGKPGDADNLVADILSLCWLNNAGKPQSAVYDFQAMSRGEIIDLVKYVSRAPALVCHNMVFDLRVIDRIDPSLLPMFRGKIHDTMVMLHVMNTEGLIGLKPNARELLGMELKEWAEASVGTRLDYLEYAREDSEACLRLYNLLAPQILDGGFSEVYSLEVNVAWGVIEMIRDGIHVDLKAYERLREQSKEHIHRYSQDLAIKAGRPINIRSTRDIGSVIFGDMKVPVGATTGSGKPSIDKASLSEILSRTTLDPRARDFIETLRDFRMYDKLASVYLSDKFQGFVGPDSRIHAEPQPLKTRTGRFSYKSPNLQQIPSRGEGAELRKAFSSPEGRRLICIDMSQIEYRLLAHFSEDKALIDCYKHGDDLHQGAADILGIDRKTAKNINFGIIYGQGVMALARALGISFDEASEYLTVYFRRFPGIQQFKDSIINYARYRGEIRTISGRRRVLSSYAHAQDGSMDRRAVNTFIQGSAADLMKLCMVRAWDAFGGTDVRIVLQVHDELILEAPEKEARDAAETIQEIIENSYQFSVPIVATPHIAKTWLEAKDD